MENDFQSVVESDEEGGSVRRRTGGRSARVREAVLKSTLEALAEVGMEGLNFSEIGRRAGVHATSVQRRWGSRENVLLEALLSYASQAIEVPDTGSLRGDLVRFARSFSDYFKTSVGSAILHMLVSTGRDESDLTANRTEFVRLRFALMRSMLDRAAERGELRDGVDLDIAFDLAVGPIYVRTLISKQPIDDAFIEKYVELLLNGVAAG
jgi:AcrR family transcriptional regulator